MIDYLANLTSRLGSGFYLLLPLNLLLLVFAPVIVKHLSGADSEDPSRDFRINALRLLNLLMAVILLAGLVSGNTLSANNPVLKVLLALMIIYFSILITQLATSYIRKRYGRRFQSQNSERVADTYASRALSISAVVFISIVALISIVRLFGFDDLLETGGVIGFVGVFLALTQAAWAPDIIGGLVILNTRMFEERDVIKLDFGSREMYARVYRTRAFHTELLNLIDNHRVMIRNSKVRDYAVHNLSKFATARGLRESLHFNIGYNEQPSAVRQMFEEAFARATERSELKFERQYEPEVRLQEAGDHAVAWSFHYYTKDADSIIPLRQAFREIILEVCVERGIDLSTPLTILHSANDVVSVDLDQTAVVAGNIKN